MSDYRPPDFDPFDPNDPYRRGAKMGPKLRPSNVVTGWIVATVFVAAAIAVIFGITHPRQLGTDTASNDMAQRGASPAMTHMAPPPAPANTPALQSTPSPLTTTNPPINPVPPTPGPSSGAH
jgi:hypothetical protein